MKLIEKRMQQLVADTKKLNEAPALELGDYRLSDTYDATRCYQVTDGKSGLTFDVTFYLYGDVLSGWNVALHP